MGESLEVFSMKYLVEGQWFLLSLCRFPTFEVVEFRALGMLASNAVKLLSRQNWVCKTLQLLWYIICYVFAQFSSHLNWFWFQFCDKFKGFFLYQDIFIKYVFLIIFNCRAGGTMGTAGKLYTGPDLCFIFHTYKATFQVI